MADFYGMGSLQWVQTLLRTWRNAGAVRRVYSYGPLHCTGESNTDASDSSVTRGIQAPGLPMRPRRLTRCHCMVHVLIVFYSRLSG